MVAETLAKSPAGAIEEIPNLKRRQQAVYLRPHTDNDGNTTWIETRPLPADFVSREMYLAKGFRLKSQGVPALDTEKEDLILKTKALEEDNARLQGLLKEKKMGRPKKVSPS